MLYDLYRDKLKRRQEKFAHLWKFRLLFLAVAMLLLAALGTLLGIGGIVYDVEVPAYAVYGEPIEVAASAVYGKAVFEYRAVGEEDWTRTVPIRAGDYECRAVGRSVAKTDRRGEIHAFTIEPAETEISVSSKSLVYGETPEFSARLQYGDVLEIAAYSQKRGGGEIEIEAEEVRILDDAGEDVTSSYHVTTAAGKVRDIMRAVSVSTENEVYTYDGAPHGTGEYTVGGTGLAEGDRFAFAFPTLTDKGRIANAPEEIHILNAAGEDVTERYAISAHYGEITVLPRPLTVTAESARCVYDGETHVFSGTAAGLVENHTVVFSELLSARAVGVYQNQPVAAVMEGTEDRTANYQITYEYGTVEIVRRPVTFTTASRAFVYDGTSHDCREDIAISEGEEIGLLEGHTYAIASAASIEEVGAKENVIAFTVKDERGEDTTENYAVTVVYGALEVTPRPLKIATGSKDLFYNGAPQRFEEYSFLGETSCAEGDTFRISFDPYTNAGEYQNIARISIDRRGRSRLSDYEITYTYGALNMKKRTVRFETPSAEFTYNGAAQRNTNWKLLEKAEQDDAAGYGVASGHRVAVKESASIVDRGSKENILTLEIRSGANNVSENYTIFYDKIGTLTVNPLKVTLKTGSGTFTYDGTEKRVESATPTGASLVSGHRAVAAYPAFVNAGKYPNTLEHPEAAQILNAAGGDVTANYELAWESGEVTIEKRGVSVVTGSTTHVYDDRDFSYPEFTVQGLANGQTCDYANAVRTDAIKAHDWKETPYTNSFSVSFKILAAGEDVTSNYDIENIKYTYGTITIEKRPLKIKTASDTRVYDGKAKYLAEWEAVYGEYPRLEGHEIAVDFLSVFTAVRDEVKTPRDNACVAKVTAGGKDVSANYAISYEFGKIAVTPRPLKITPDVVDGDPTAKYDESKPETRTKFYYDGFRHKFTSYFRLDDTALAEGEKLGLKNPESDYTFKDAGTYQVVWEFKVTAGDADVTENYNIEYDRATIQIYKRPVIVTTESYSWVYDGTPHSYGKFTEAPGKEGLDGALGYGASMQLKDSSVLPSVTVVSDTKAQNNVFDIVIYDQTAAHVDVTERNYEVSYVYGTLSITKRPVVFTTDDGTWEYDDTPHSKLTASDASEGENTGLIGDHRAELIDVTKKTEITEVGSASNEIVAKIIIKSGAGADMTENYEPSIGKFGTLTVTQREVTLKTDDGTHEYDYTDFSVRTYKAISNTLVAGHTVEAEWKSFRDAGVYDNDFDALNVKIKKGDTDVTRNYKITWDVWGKITISQRGLRLTTDSKQKMYDATALYEEGHHFDRVVGGHTLNSVVTSHTEVTNCAPSPTNNVLTVEFTVTVSEGGKQVDVTKNYTITERVWGKLTVTPRPISVETIGGSWVYDGTMHFDRTDKNHLHVDYSAAPKIDGHEVQVTFTNSEGERLGSEDISYFNNLANVHDREIHNRLGCFITIVDAELSPVTENYEITKIYGTVNVSPRPMTVTTGSHTWVYDGEEHYQADFTLEQRIGESDRGFIGDPSRILPLRSELTNVREITDEQDESGEYIRAGYVENVFALDVLFYENVHVKRNYEIDYVYGRLRVKSPVVVHINTVTKEYDGTPLTHTASDKFIMAKPPEVEEGMVTVRIEDELTEAGSITLQELMEKKLAAGTVARSLPEGEDPDRVDFEGDETVLTVRQRTIRISTVSIFAVWQKDKTLLGTETDQELAWVSFNSLLEGHTFTYRVTGTLPPEEGSAYNTIEDVHIWDTKRGEAGDAECEVTENYNIEFSFGMLAWLTEEIG